MQMGWTGAQSLSGRRLNRKKKLAEDRNSTKEVMYTSRS